MDDPWLSKSLWEMSNVITGFSIVQTLAFAYKMAEPALAERIDSTRAKIVIAAVTVVTFGSYIGVFIWCGSKLALLDCANKPLYLGAAWGRVAVAILLLFANLAALFGRQILLGGWLFGYPHPTLIAAATAGPVTIIGRATISAAGVLTVTDRSGHVAVPVGKAAAEQLARSGALHRVIVVGRVDAQGRLNATQILDARGQAYRTEQPE